MLNSENIKENKSLDLDTLRKESLSGMVHILKIEKTGVDAEIAITLAVPLENEQKATIHDLYDAVRKCVIITLPSSPMKEGDDCNHEQDPILQFDHNSAKFNTSKKEPSLELVSDFLDIKGLREIHNARDNRRRSKSIAKNENLEQTEEDDMHIPRVECQIADTLETEYMADEMIDAHLKSLHFGDVSH